MELRAIMHAYVNADSVLITGDEKTLQIAREVNRLNRRVGVGYMRKLELHKAIYFVQVFGRL